MIENKLKANYVAKVRVREEFRTLAGLVGSWVEVSAESMETSVYVQADQPFDKVFINGKEYEEI